MADTAPLLSAAYRDDPAHDLASVLVSTLGRDLVVLDARVRRAELEHLIRAAAACAPGASRATAGFTSAAELDHRRLLLWPQRKPPRRPAIPGNGSV